MIETARVPMEGARSEEKCPNCGKTLTAWPEQSYVQDGVSYCCRGCAEGTGCTCAG
jgi:hypothetical protein